MQKVGIESYRMNRCKRNQLNKVLTLIAHSSSESLWFCLKASSNFTELGLTCFFFSVFHIFWNSSLFDSSTGYSYSVGTVWFLIGPFSAAYKSLELIYMKVSLDIALQAVQLMQARSETKEEIRPPSSLCFTPIFESIS
jgi:hypothetical protein